MTEKLPEAVGKRWENSFDAAAEKHALDKEKGLVCPTKFYSFIEGARYIEAELIRERKRIAELITFLESMSKRSSYNWEEGKGGYSAKEYAYEGSLALAEEALDIYRARAKEKND